MSVLAFVAALITAIAAGGGVATVVNRRAQGHKIEADTAVSSSTALKLDAETQAVTAKDLYGPLIESLQLQILDLRAQLAQARVDGDAAVARARVEADAGIARARLESSEDYARIVKEHAECVRRIAVLEAALVANGKAVDDRIDARIADLAKQFGITIGKAEP